MAFVAYLLLLRLQQATTTVSQDQGITKQVRLLPTWISEATALASQSYESNQTPITMQYRSFARTVLATVLGWTLIAMVITPIRAKALSKHLGKIGEATKSTSNLKIQIPD